MTSTEVSRPKRGHGSIGDMLRSLGVVAAVVAVTLIFVPGLLHPSKSQLYSAPVNVPAYLTAFHELSGRPALTPATPAGWTVNGATLNGDKTTAHLHVGYLTSEATYAEVEEGVQPAAVFARSVLGPRGAAVTGAMTVAGRTWQTRTSSRGEYALTDTSRGVTVVVTGSASNSELQQLASSLP